MNFFSYADNRGMQFHPNKELAKAACEAALREFLHNNITAADVINNITWGEVTERAAAVDGNAPILHNQLRLTYETEHPQVVDGRMRDGNDSLVLVKNIHETDLLYHDLVLSVAVIWKNLSGKVQRFKQYNFQDVAATLGLLYEKYQVERGGRDGNMQFFTHDRKFKLAIAIQKKIDFGPELQAAERKLNAALEEMTSTESDSGADLKTIVTGAFTLVDGKLRVSEVLRLRSYKITNATWNEAMQIIDDAIVVISSKKQIRLYERNEVGDYINIPLDIAAL